MKYLKFLTQRNISSSEDYSHMNFTFIISDTPDGVFKFKMSDVKAITVNILDKELANVQAAKKKYELESAFFKIAKKHLIGMIKQNSVIKVNEEVFVNSNEYLRLDFNSLVVFHNQIIKIN